MDVVYPPQSKICRTCAALLPTSEFYRSSRNADGYRSQCKRCYNETMREARDTPESRTKRRAYKVAHRPEHRVLTKAWRDRHPDQKRAEVKRLREQYPEKYRARKAVSNAIRDGRLQRHACEACGAKAQAHHDDYNRPLEVRWLCPVHHAEEHGRSGECCSPIETPHTTRKAVAA